MKRLCSSEPLCYVFLLGLFMRGNDHVSVVKTVVFLILIFRLTLTGGAGVIFSPLNQQCLAFLMRLTPILWAAASILYTRSKLVLNAQSLFIRLLCDLRGPAAEYVPPDSPRFIFTLRARCELVRKCLLLFSCVQEISPWIFPPVLTSTSLSVLYVSSPV